MTIQEPTAIKTAPSILVLPFLSILGGVVVGMLSTTSFWYMPFLLVVAFIPLVSLQKGVLLLLTCSILLPDVKVPLIGLARPELMLIPFLFLSYLRQRGRVKQLDQGYGKVLALFTFCMMVSISNALFRGQGTVSTSDFLELVKPWDYYLYFLAASSVAQNETSRNRTSNLLAVVAILAAVFAADQAFDLTGLARRITPFYRRDWDLGFLLAQSRVLGTTGNPNTFATLLAILQTNSLAVLFLGRTSPTQRLLHGSAIALTSLAVLLTASRTGLVLLIVAFVTVMITTGKITRASGRLKRITNLILILIFVGGMLMVAVPQMGRNIRRLQGLRNPLGQTSVISRVQTWRDNIEKIKENPIVGVGPNKAEIGKDLDNYYLTVLKRYGAIGFGVFFYLIISLGVASFRRVRANAVGNLWHVLSFSGVVVLLFAAIMSRPFDNQQTMPLFWFVAGISKWVTCGAQDSLSPDDSI